MIFKECTLCHKRKFFVSQRTFCNIKGLKSTEAVRPKGIWCYKCYRTFKKNKDLFN